MTSTKRILKMIPLGLHSARLILLRAVGALAAVALLSATQPVRAEWLWDDTQDVNNRFFVMLGQVIPPGCREPKVAQSELGIIPMQKTWANREAGTIVHQVVIRASNECLQMITQKLRASDGPMGKAPVPKKPELVDVSTNDSEPSVLLTFKATTEEINQLERSFNSLHASARTGVYPEPQVADALDLTRRCSPLTGVKPFKTDEEKSDASIPICKLSNGIWFKADMDIDCDGGSTQLCKSDRSYRPDTSCSAKGKYLDASFLPYIVLPLDSNGLSLKNLGIRCGSIGAVVYNGKIVYGVVGDRGPKGVIGEASHALAKQLGIYADPNKGGAPYGVTYIVFSGSEGLARSISDTSEINARGKALLIKAIDSAK